MFENAVLYHSVIDARCRFIRVFLALKGIDFSLSAHEDWQTSADVFALNPARSLPIMQCKNATIVGAVPIVETVEENFSVGRIFGATMAERAENRRLLEWFFYKFETEVYTPIIDVRYYKTHTNISTLNRARKNMRIHFRYVTSLLENRICLNTEHPGVADYCAGAYISSLDYFSEIAWKSYPQIKEWYQLIKCQPCFCPILENRVVFHMPPPHYAQVDF